jgi:hypothetical protein
MCKSPKMNFHFTRRIVQIDFHCFSSLTELEDIPLAQPLL